MTRKKIMSILFTGIKYIMLCRFEEGNITLPGKETVYKGDFLCQQSQLFLIEQ